MRFLFLLVALGACTQAPPKYGSLPADAVKLADSPLFQHYLGTLDGAEGYTVGDLFTKPIAFSSAPTPRALLQAEQGSNPPAAAGAVTLRFLTYNVALLDAKLFGLFQYTGSPKLAERAAVMWERVLGEGYDVIGFQEVWRTVDIDRLRAVAETMGYWVATSSRDGFSDGLAIAVKKTVASGPDAQGYGQYADTSSVEFFPAPGLSRGYHWVRFSTAAGSMLVYNTHTAAFVDQYTNRMSNARELATDLTSRVQAGELAFVLGDLNASPYYRKDVWDTGDGGTAGDWFANTFSYVLFLHYGGLTDLAVRGRSAADAALDVDQGDLVVNEPATSLTVPFGDASYCANRMDIVFSATDCNPLYFEQYAGTEFPARLDYVLARDPDGRVHVSAQSLVFTEEPPLSDHYGQAVTLEISP